MNRSINKIKQRTIKDLALFINNNPDKDEKKALYSMLLGSGASASSGIRTGQQLVNQWLIDIYKRYNQQNEESTIEEIRDFLDKECYDWYNKDNEYASLFGKIYDLPSQRRNFIEREIGDEKEPSIGYKYLNNLAFEHKIDTFFTTNFDDLLEKAFSPYNNIKRPIVCAHDSSIFNLSVHSNRTKIIKLHGDFLFNDIKSSSEEVNKLNKNTKDKFEEFLKVYGLIVVGYAGNDNSIMDILEQLVDKDEYLNNGIYWCIRKADFESNKLSSKLIKLLEHEKVYYILINDFDSFCAELAHEVLPKISIGTPFSARASEQNEYFTSQKKLHYNCKYIVSDINNYLSENNPTNRIDNLTTYSEDTKKINKEYRNEIVAPEEQDIVTLIKNNQYIEALEIIDKSINYKINIDEIPSFIYNKYMNYKITCLIALEKKEDAIANLDKIISYNNEKKLNSNIQYFVDKANIVDSYKEKILLLETAYSQDKSDYKLLNSIAECKIYQGNIDNDAYKEIKQIYDKSISIENSAENPSYLDKLDFVIKYKEKEEDIENTCKQIIDNLEDKDFYSHAVYKAKLEQEYIKIKERKENIEAIEKIFEKYINDNYIYERNLFYVVEYMDILSRLNKTTYINKLFQEFDSKYSDAIPYIVKKANCAINNYYDNDLALNIMENIDKRILKISGRERLRYFSMYLRLLSNKAEHEKAVKFIEEQPDANILMKLDTYLENLFHVDENRFLEKIMSNFEKSEKSTDDYITYTYNLLKLKEYDEIYDIYQRLINDSSYNNVDKNNSVLIINYSLAKKLRKNHSKIRENNLENILKEDKDSLTKAAAYILLDDVNKAMKILKKELDKDYMMYYRLQEMPVFENIKFGELKKQPIKI